MIKKGDEIMIYTEIKNLLNYRGIGKNLDAAIDFLCAHPLEEFKPGHYEIDGENLYLNVFDYDTVLESEAFFEAHQKYADIHMTVTGEEVIGVSDTSRVTLTQKGADLFEADGAVEHYIKISPGKALVTLPEDAHKVKMACGQPAPVRKAVIKVYLG